jgi:ribonuclease HII
MDRFEQRLYQQGHQRIAGVDEVGRGALAGPLVVALVILDRRQSIPGLNDSKQLTAAKREALNEQIQAKARYIDIEVIDAPRIDQINILQATKLAMRTLLERATFDHALIDAVPLKRPDVTSIIKGDTLSMSIAAASIVAKVARDAMMVALAQSHPQYHFEANKGYGTPQHLHALKTHGPLKGIHRFSFAPVASAFQMQLEL